MTAQKHTPDRIRVAQDAEGYWTCREAVSGSQEYVRADIVDGLLGALQDLLLAYSEPDQPLCCDGRDCGCMGSSVHQQADHYARAAIARIEGHSNG